MTPYDPQYIFATWDQKWINWLISQNCILHVKNSFLNQLAPALTYYEHEKTPKIPKEDAL